MFGNSNSTSYLHRTESLELLASGHNVCFVEFRCRRPDCGECDSDAETATVHSDCLQLFAREYKLEDVLDRLWVIAAWRSPWRGAHNLRLAEARLFMPDLSAAEALDLLKLRDLPPEILNWIRIYSPTSLFWRYSSVLELARGLSKAAASESACKDILSIPLPLIWTWKRGELPVSIAPSEVSAPAISPKAPIIRLTIDSYGLREVERLQEKPPYRTWRSDHLAYVIVEEHSLKHAVMHFKVALIPNLVKESVALTVTGSVWTFTATVSRTGARPPNLGQPESTRSPSLPRLGTHATLRALPLHRVTA